MKKKHQYILLLLFIVSISVNAQGPSTKERNLYDSITYHYFLESNWDSVIDIGKEALYKGYDFYFLRMRLGLAYDYQGNYRLAEIQYNKALEWVPPDPNAAYYKYYAAINGGRSDVAYTSYKKYNQAQKKIIYDEFDNKLKYLFDQDKSDLYQKINVKAFEQISIYYGYSFTGNQNKLATIFPNKKNILYSEGIIRNTQSYFNFYLAGNFSTNFKWQFSYANNRINGDYLLQSFDVPHFEYPLIVNQNEFFASIEAQSGKGWSLSFTANLLAYKSDFYISTQDSYNFHLPEDDDTILIATPNFESEYGTFSDQDYVFGAVFKRKVNIVDFSLFATYGKISTYQPWQVGADLTILPKGNYSLYLTNRILYFNDGYDGRFIYKVTTGGTLIGKLGFEAIATFGNLKYTTEPGTGITYNWNENSRFKGDIILSHPVADKVYLKLQYQLSQKKKDYTYYKVVELIDSETYPNYYEPQYEEQINQYFFNQHFIIAAIVWYL